MNFQGEQIRYNERVYTRDIVEFLIKQRDQVSTTAKIAYALGVSESCTREGLERLKKVNRVDEIHRDMWHLE
jgi:Mn-dependent DtxR family transcriptional regulator